jgi:hypothetical protein
VGELQQRADRALELRPGRHYLAEQVKFAGPGQAQVGDDAADPCGLTRGRDRLQRRDLQRQPDRADGDDEEDDEIEGGDAGKSKKGRNLKPPGRT